MGLQHILSSCRVNESIGYIVPLTTDDVKTVWSCRICAQKLVVLRLREFLFQEDSEDKTSFLIWKQTCII